MARQTQGNQDVSSVSHVSTRSLWQATDSTTLQQNYPILHGDIQVDVAIVGAGITGLTTALLLHHAGKRVAVIDRRTVGSGVSGMNSGHLTSILLDFRYSTIIKHFGVEQSIEVARSQEEAINLIERIHDIYQMDIDFKRIPGYLYAEDMQQLDSLMHEFDAFKKLVIPCSLSDPAPLPFPTLQSIRVSNQARFHPLKYVQRLAKEVAQAGHYVFENSPIEVMHYEDPCQLETEYGSIRAEQIVLATHTPISFWPALQTRLEPSMSYIIGFKPSQWETPQGPLMEDALYWDMKDTYHYTRPVPVVNNPGEPPEMMIIIGGEDHRTGEKRETHVCLDNLAQYARDRYPDVSVTYQWSAQLFHSADGLPYIGAMHSHPNVYIATGFSGEGLTGGTYAAQIITDLIAGKPNPWAEIYDPNRFNPRASAGGFLSENLGTVFHWVGDRFKPAPAAELSGIRPGEGKIVIQDSKKVAAYCDEHTHELHMMSPVCTHMGCLVAWNDTERTWDCPCHGGRYDATGGVLAGPPLKPLEKLDKPASKEQVHSS